MATYVLIHGSFQGGWIWQPTVKLLRPAGHLVYAPTMDGCAERRHFLRDDITAETMAQEVVDLFHYEDLSDVVLAGTSTSGIVISKVAELAPEKVKRLVYIDALAPQPGETTADIVIREPGAPPYEESRFARGPGRTAAAQRLFSDFPPDLLEWAMDRVTLHPKRGGEANLDKFWSQEWPATVIYCTKSFNPSEAHQRRTADKLNADWVALEAGHYPMLSDPEETAALLLQEAEK